LGRWRIAFGPPVALEDLRAQEPGAAAPEATRRVWEAVEPRSALGAAGAIVRAMRSRLVATGLAVASLCALATGCGGSSRLSASAYRARLAAIAREANAAQARVETALRAKSVASIRTRLGAFAGAEDRLGDEVAGLKAPKNAQSANSELARGEHDVADEVRSAVARLSKLKSAKAALSFLQSSLAAAKGGREVDHALTQLKKLGYTKGS
jgi:hypothetical protein